jgi:uracil-DNA glycosylase
MVKLPLVEFDRQMKKINPHSTLSLAEDILGFYQSLQPRFPLPEGVEIMHPYREEAAWQAATRFYHRYYGEQQRRVLLLGINPGRFGAGVTGVPFTDPIRREQVCGIPNDFVKKQELSSLFVYDVADAYGGPAAFYRHFFVTAVCPLGFVRNGRNMNYYDDKALLAACEPFIVATIRHQLIMLGSPARCACLGDGTNYKHLQKLNERYGFFEQIIPLPHPRWVMQYRRKQKDVFVQQYVKVLRELAGAVS